MLFFALFGLTRPEDLQMTKKVDSWVESWVKLIMATYLLLTGIVLINLLIAMMSDTYQRISVMKRLQIKAYGLMIISHLQFIISDQNNISCFYLQQESDVEWKKGRTTLIRNMHRTNASPAPINLITTWALYLHQIYKRKPQICFLMEIIAHFIIYRTTQFMDLFCNLYNQGDKRRKTNIKE